MTALVDTNVVLDVMLQRTPHLKDSASILAAIERGYCNGLLCATTVTTIFYIAQREIGEKNCRAEIAKLLSLFGVAAVGKPTLTTALATGFQDYEDSVLHESARSAGVDCIVTRNLKDFKRSKILAYTPAQFLTVLDGKS